MKHKNIKEGDYITFTYDKEIISVVLQVDKEWVKHSSLTTNNIYECHIDECIKIRNQKQLKSVYG